ncbi:hypothetical protein [Paenibacillus dendritiformis]
MFIAIKGEESLRAAQQYRATGSDDNELLAILDNVFEILGGVESFSSQ